MNYAAIAHQATQFDCFCLEPGKFLFRLQSAAGDLRRVTLHSLDKYLPLHIRDTRKATEMRWVASDGLRDYYEAVLEFDLVCLRYCFELEDQQGQRVFFSNTGFTPAIPDDIERRIFVFERASQFELLAENAETFMWVSPVSQKLLDRYGLVQRGCAENKKLYKDVLIYREGYKLSNMDRRFITELCEARRKYLK